MSKHLPVDYSVERNTYLSFGLALAVILIACWLFYYNQTRFIENIRWVSHSHEIIEQVEEAFSILKDAESGQRGYVITGDERFLESYTQSINDVETRFEQVRRLTADNPSQQRRLEALALPLATKLDFLSTVIDARRRGDADEAVSLVSSGKGKAEMDAVRVIVDDIEREETNLLGTRNELMLQSERLSLYTLFSVAALVLLFFSLVCLLMRRGFKVRRQIEFEQNRQLAIIEASPDYIGVADMNGNIVYTNRAGQEMVGIYETERSEQMPITDLYPEWALKLITGVGIPTAIREGSWLGETAFLAPDKREIPTSQMILAHKDKTGEVKYFSTIARDITVAKKAEKALRESEFRYRDLTDKSLGLICTHDLTGRLLSINPAAARALGYAPAELIGTMLGALLSPATKPLFAQYLKTILTVTAGEISGNMTILTKSGEERIWHFNNVLFGNDTDESYVLGHAQDITDLKRVEQALKESRQLFERFMNNSPALIFMKDIEGKYVFLNEPMERLFNIRLSEMRGQTDLYFLPPEIAEQVRLNDDLVLKNNETLEKIEIVPTPDGRKRYWQTYKFPILDAAGKRFVGGVSFDVSERIEMESELKKAHGAALESVRMKSEFLANMSHEIRTPMNGVIGMTGVLLDTRLDDEQKDYVETIQKSADALLRIIDDILDFSKIEAGQLRFEKIDFDLRDCVESSVEVLAGRAQAKGIEIASLVHKDVSKELRGDPGRLRQVLTNLLGNAVKFTEKGEVVINVLCENESEHHTVLRFEVKDTGIGVPLEAQARLFHAFTQADGSTTRKYGGTGLGLAISKQLVEMMNGEIGIQSAPGAGSIFRFTARFEKQPKAATPARDETDTDTLKGIRVLIVDNNETNRKILLHQTASWEMICTEADSGKAALESLRAAAADDNPFEIVILDLQMPDIGGFELARAIKANPATALSHLILLPSFGKRGDGQMAREIGIAAYLQKPVRQSQLYNCLMSILFSPADQLESDKSVSPRLITRHSLPKPVEVEKIVETTPDSGKILVVEDNSINQKVARIQLKGLGYSADIAANGREALRALERSDYEAILMDCQMPEMDGFEATAEIRRIEKVAGKRSVIIAMTANALEGDSEKCLAAGMDDYLSKPVGKEQLERVLEKWIVSKTR